MVPGDTRAILLTSDPLRRTNPVSGGPWLTYTGSDSADGERFHQETVVPSALPVCWSSSEEPSGRVECHHQEGVDQIAVGLQRQGVLDQQPECVLVLGQRDLGCGLAGAFSWFAVAGWGWPVWVRCLPR